MQLRHWILLVALGAIWGGSFLFAKVAVTEIPPFMLVFFRVSIACLALLIVLGVKGKLPEIPLAMVPAFLLMGLLNNAIPFSLLFLGQTEIGAGLASILNAATPLFTFFVASVLVRQEPIRLHRLIGVLLGLAGVATMLSDSLSGMSADPLAAQVSCLGAALSYAFAATFAKRFRALPPEVSATGQLGASTVIMLPVALLTTGAWSISDPSPAAWASVIALALVSTAFAYLIYFRLLAEAGATNASLVTLLVPVSALVLGSLVLGETLSLVQFAGFAVLLAGLIVLDGRFVTVHRAARVK